MVVLFLYNGLLWCYGFLARLMFERGWKDLSGMRECVWWDNFLFDLWYLLDCMPSIQLVYHANIPCHFNWQNDHPT